jgi:hypothetical protein
MDAYILDNYTEVDNYTEEDIDIDLEGNNMLGNMIVEEHVLHHRRQTTIPQVVSNKLPEVLPLTIL